MDPKKLARSVYDGLDLMPPQMLVEVLNGIMTPSSSPESIGTVEKLRVVDALQNLLHHLLDDLILEIVDPKWSFLGWFAGLWNLYLSYGSRPVSHPLHPCDQIS